jgi:hypothetical protein
MDRVKKAIGIISSLTALTVFIPLEIQSTPGGVISIESLIRDSQLIARTGAALNYLTIFA